MKKLFALLLVTALGLSMPMLAFAQNGYQDYQNDLPPLHPVSIEGYIENETDDTIEIASQDGNDRVILNITSETYIVDAESGTPLSLEDLGSGRVIAYYGPIVGLSEPPVSTALLILGNISEDTIPPRFGEVEAISVMDDEVIVTIRSGTMLVTIERGIQIDPLFTRNNVTIDDIEVGSHLLIWYPIVSASRSGQATATRVVILNRAAPVEVVEDNNYEDYNYNGYENDYQQDYETTEDYYNQQPPTYQPPYAFTQPAAPSLASVLAQISGQIITENNITMAPLRHVAEAFGYSVTWNEANRSITLRQYADGQVYKTLVIGQQYFEGHTLQTAPIIRNDRTFVPVSFFEILLGL